MGHLPHDSIEMLAQGEGMRFELWEGSDEGGAWASTLLGESSAEKRDRLTPPSIVAPNGSFLNMTPRSPTSDK